MNFIDNGFDPKTPGIYKITNTINDKVYIGSSNCCRTRFYGHRNSLRNKKHRSAKLQNSFNLYGETSFRFEILEPVLDLSKLIIVEQVYIDWYKASKLGYNISGVAGRVEVTEEMKRKVSLFHTGKTMSQEVRDKIRATQKGKIVHPGTLAGSRALALKNRDIKTFEDFLDIVKLYMIKIPRAEICAKHGIQRSTLTRVFRKPYPGAYEDFLVKINFNGTSITDLRKPEIQVQLKYI